MSALTRTLSIRNKTKGTLPRIPFARIKREILGDTYELSVAFVSSRVSRRLNRIYRKKDAPANVLSFPLSPFAGEIIIDRKETARTAPMFRMSARPFLGKIFIHACLHLKGLGHGSTMDKKEEAYCAQFGFHA